MRSQLHPSILCGGGDTPRRFAGIIADIGCDHGLLAVAFAKAGAAAVAVDIAALPLQNAAANARRCGVAVGAPPGGAAVTTVLGDARAAGWPFLPAACRTAVIAGVGAPAAAAMAEAAPPEVATPVQS